MQMMANMKAVLLKIVLAGESFVGKTSILKRYTDSKFDASFLTTVGIDFKVKTITIDGIAVKLQIWDTAGQERFHTLTTNYLRGAHGIVLVYDITNIKSFKNVSGWIRDVDKFHLESDDKSQCSAVTKKQGYYRIRHCISAFIIVYGMHLCKKWNDIHICCEIFKDFCSDDAVKL
ncbi:ras-related protein Rab-10-like [Protopterus annectens]|uniref:ras-related protein Rab-10-like n=1 Tax=Protopterus annectens TaxID=7888 RepID=UPI001CFC41A1|nr:ras-related protein Rab-10-like [Protopterus annectens]